MNDLDVMIERLGKRAVDLHQATDELNAEIERFEERVRTTNPGVEAWLEAQDDGGWRFGWARRADRTWGFVARRLDLAPLPLFSTARSVRVLASQHLAAIVTALFEETAAATAAVDTARFDLEADDHG